MSAPSFSPNLQQPAHTNLPSPQGSLQPTLGSLQQTQGSLQPTQGSLHSTHSSLQPSISSLGTFDSPQPRLDSSTGLSETSGGHHHHLNSEDLNLSQQGIVIHQQQQLEPIHLPVSQPSRVILAAQDERQGQGRGVVVSMPG